MLIMMFTTSMLVASSVMFLSTNPLSMGIIILFMSLITTMMISFTLSSWLGFLVFLIYISGMLVLFSYFVAITPNIPSSSIMMNVSTLALIMITLMIMANMPSIVPIIQQPSTFLTFMYSSPSNMLLIMLALILLLTMVIVVKLISMKNGPLRPFNTYV